MAAHLRERIAFGALIILTLVGCGSATKTPSPFQGALDSLGDQAIDGGGERIATLAGRAVRGEPPAGFLVMLESSRCYAVLAMGDEALKSIALKVTAPSGSWVARTDAQEPRPIARFCAKQSGPHRVLASFGGRGAYLVSVYGPKPPGPAGSAATTLPAVHSAGAPVRAECPAIGTTEPFHRLVPGSQRTCAVDGDCIAVKLDCSQLVCGGVNRSHRTAYALPINCQGYAGPIGNYDCDPQFGIEGPRCNQGCCASERVIANP